MKADKKIPERRKVPVWVLLTVVLLLSFFLRLTGIWRTEPMDWHSDEWNLSQPVTKLANTAEQGLITRYNWPGIGVIRITGYSLYALRGWFGPYSNDKVLIILRVLSALTATVTVLFVFIAMRKLGFSNGALLGSALVGVAQLPVQLGHYGTLNSIVSLIIVTVIWLSYDLFEIGTDKDGRGLRIGRCCLLGLLCGWGISIKWTILLAAIPISGFFFLSLWYQRRAGKWNEFIGGNSKRIGIILGMLVIGFLAGCPDIQFAPAKVIDGFNYEMLHHKTGHYGSVLVEEGTWQHRFVRTFKVLNGCGNVYTLIAGIGAVIFCFVRPSRAKVFLLWIIFVWLLVVFRNFIAGSRHHLIPFIVMLMIIAVALGEGLKSRIGRVRIACWLAFAFLVVSGALYTCITISPLWRPDSTLECANWIRANIPGDNGLTWAPLSAVDKELAKEYPRQGSESKDQYIIASHVMMRRFAKHPLSRRVIASEWFPSKPPSTAVLALYAEMNAGGGPNLTLVKEFYRAPSFMGMDSRLFLQSARGTHIMANRAVTLFRFNKVERNVGGQ